MRYCLDDEKSKLIALIKEGLTKKDNRDSIFTVYFIDGKMKIEISAEAVSQISVVQNQEG